MKDNSETIKFICVEKWKSVSALLSGLPWWEEGQHGRGLRIPPQVITLLPLHINHPAAAGP